MDDLISRQAVLKLLSTMPPEETTTKALLIQSVKQMDAAQPEKRTGERTETHACDCISRQTAIAALGERPMVWNGNDYELGARNQYDADVLALETVPSAQPEIIRCRECKHYTFADNRAFGFPAKRCEWTGFEDVDDDDFCSRAERREGNE